MKWVNGMKVLQDGLLKISLVGTKLEYLLSTRDVTLQLQFRSTKFPLLKSIFTFLLTQTNESNDPSVDISDNKSIILVQLNHIEV